MELLVLTLMSVKSMLITVVQTLPVSIQRVLLLVSVIRDSLATASPVMISLNVLPPDTTATQMQTAWK